ncbi:MAG: alpha/beta hydrolase family protein [Victivallaceae bacterium]|nr:alpha/beta hydrolase family protein [Victivallaceae bacterium]
MAFIQCSFHSDALKMACSMNVIIPQVSATQIGMESGRGKKEYPVLYLLHGCSDDHTIWGRRSSIERYVAGRDLAVVMPEAHRSFYTDMKSGGQYWTFISEELPRIVKALFPVSAERRNTFVAGLSMGGYGAFKLALRCPEKFAAAASLSGVTDICQLWNAGFDGDMKLIFGSPAEFKDSENDLFKLSAELMKSGRPAPALFQACGTEDFLYADNIRFRDHLRKLGCKLHYQEAPGIHAWDFWDAQIQDVLKWLPL